MRRGMHLSSSSPPSPSPMNRRSSTIFAARTNRKSRPVAFASSPSFSSSFLHNGAASCTKFSNRPPVFRRWRLHRTRISISIAPRASVAKGGEAASPGGNDTASPEDNISDSAAAAIVPSESAEVERPSWAPEWLPDFFINLKNRPWLQLAIMMPLYLVHLFVFSTRGWTWGKPLIPNDKDLFQSLGFDSVVGAVVAVGFLIWRKFFMKVDKQAPKEPLIPSLLTHENPPWRVPREAKKRLGSTTAFLVIAFLFSGYFALIVEQILYLLAGYNFPLTVATTRAWKVLLGHLMWVFMGIKILRRLKPFFPPKGTWLRWKWKENWLWWAIGGYYVSALLFNIADVINTLILPSSMFEEETVVSKLINPENKDPAAMAIGSIGPCISAPVFEEVLYRGFLLPALSCFLPMWASIPASSVLFALHHLNPTSVLPLSVLGLVWAILYTRSRNLSVTILIHAMWNSRVFLSSFLGLKTYTDFE